ncbi:MAG: S9 family peptidase [Myxococcales bacterium]|nr:S9 family peptidase [Myxococcales bacterium]
MLAAVALGACPPRPTPKTPLLGAKAERPLRYPELLERFALTYRFRLGHPRAVRVTPDGKHALFLRSAARSFEHRLYELDLASGRERLVSTAAKLLGGAREKLSAEEKARRERMRRTARGISAFRMSRDGSKLLVALSGRLFVIERQSGKARELPSALGYAIDAQFSPDGTMVACVRRGALYVIDLERNTQRRLTPVATKAKRYGVAEFVAQEEMGRYHGYWWAPDSRRIAFAEVDNSKVERLYVASPAHPTKRPRAFRYPRAGRTNATVRLGVVWLSSGATRWLRRDAKAWPYVATVRWQGGPLLVVMQDRRQRAQRVVRYDAKGAGKVLVEEKVGSGWIAIDQSVPRWVGPSQAPQLLWSAVRGDRRVLELYDAEGKKLRAVLAASAGYRRVIGVDRRAARVYFEGGAEPTRSQVSWASLAAKDAAKAPHALSSGRGLHDGELVARRDGGPALWVHRFAGPDGTRRVAIARVDAAASQPAPLPTSQPARAPGASTGAAAPSERVIKSVAEPLPPLPGIERVSVGARGFHALIIRPRDFDAKKRYPVIVYVYGGPHHLVVRDVAHRYVIQQWLADQGFIVVMLDGRGTPYRGVAWEQAIAGNFVRVPLADQVSGLLELGKRYAELDVARSGVFGWSFGGYLSAMAVLLRPDIYKAAVAGAPVTTWADYDSHYTERYLGLPSENRTGYRDSSALHHATKLVRPLLLVHGTTDDNVYFSHTLKLSRALFLAGKHHEVQPLSGLTHMVPVANVTKRLYGRIAHFFQRHLGAPLPRLRK